MNMWCPLWENVLHTIGTIQKKTVIIPDKTGYTIVNFQNESIFVYSTLLSNRDIFSSQHGFQNKTHLLPQLGTKINMVIKGRIKQLMERIIKLYKLRLLLVILRISLGTIILPNIDKQAGVMVWIML